MVLSNYTVAQLELKKMLIQVKLSKPFNADKYNIIKAHLKNIERFDINRHDIKKINIIKQNEDAIKKMQTNIDHKIAFINKKMKDIDKIKSKKDDPVMRVKYLTLVNEISDALDDISLIKEDLYGIIDYNINLKKSVVSTFNNVNIKNINNGENINSKAFEYVAVSKAIYDELSNLEDNNLPNFSNAAKYMRDLRRKRKLKRIAEIVDLKNNLK